MVEACLKGIVLVFQWPAIIYLLIGVFVGIWIGAIPGLGGIIGLVMLLPFTYGMEPVPAFALLLGMYAVTTTGDTIASVLLGIPGTAASQATILDGYPLAKQGQAQRAFGAAFTVSAFGGIFSAALLALSLPLVLPIIRTFNNPEIFMLGVLGLSMVATLSSASVRKGLVVALLGLLVSTVGYGETAAVPRYWFGTTYLLDGAPLIPIVLGLFAIPELLELAVGNISISRVSVEETKDITIMSGVRDALRHWWLAVRCACLGTYIGMLPGLGGSISDWIAYGHAVQSAKDKSRFGSGDIRGVIAPEAANNAVKGGILIPTVSFGIPGSLGAAILLGAMLMQGLRPGPAMLTTQLHVTFSMVWTIVVANIVAALLLMLWSRQVARIAFIRGHLIVPGALVFIFMGAFMTSASLGDWITCLLAGVLGFVMKRGGWPRPPMVLAMVLGGILENAMEISMMAYRGPGWLLRPVVIIIFALTVLTLFLAARGILRSRRAPAGRQAAGEGIERNPVVSLPLTVLLLVLFGAAGIRALGWVRAVAMFPLTITVPAVGLCVWILRSDLRAAQVAHKEAGTWSEAIREAANKAGLGRSALFFLYLLAIILVAPLAGQMVALCAFVAVYLRRWGSCGWPTSLLYAAGAGALLHGFYGMLLNVFWMPSLLSRWLS